MKRSPFGLAPFALPLLLSVCGGRAASPPSSSAFAPLDAGDDGSLYGGILAASDAPYSYDSTFPSPRPAPADDSTAASGDDAALASGDDGSTVDGDDAGCTAIIGPGDLVIDELLIESVIGAGDHGEWFEVRSSLPCAVNLRGLHGDCPHGAKAATFDVAGDLWIPPGGTFVVADSVSPALNHDVPLPVIAWQGNVGDVLRNKGTTLTLSLAGNVIDTLTYPALPLTVGTSLEFPSDCDPSTRADFTKWQPSQSSWFPGFLGTPNAPNTDVSCPM
ncbi:MAG: hypothetical protein ACRENE_26575 [Polyangiaceae bacterium]